MPDRYSFCESFYASGRSLWHVRRLTKAGRKLGGGADTMALCGRSVAWDLEAEITQHHLDKNTCPTCHLLLRREGVAVEQ